jgi:hypothetical protein
MPFLPFPEWKPDVSDYQGASSQVIQNVLPRGDGYAPAPGLSPFTAALPAPCRGAFYARNADGSITTLAATATRLWKLNNSDFTWIPVSRVVALTSISNASPAVFALTAHGRQVGDAIVLSTTGALPAGLTVGTVYYIIAAGFSANAFEVALTPGGAAINTSSAGSGTHSFTGSYTTVAADRQWQFAQFNNLVFTTQASDLLQVIDLTAASAFSNALGSPPQAAFVAVINRFLVLTGLLSFAYRVQWSGLNNVNASASWDNVTAQSNFQDLADGGITRGTAGGDNYGIVFQDSAIRSMTFNPGSPEVFDFLKISQGEGILAPYSSVNAGGQTFFVSTQGFKVIAPGGAPTPIGKEKFDRTFLADVDQGNLQLTIAAADPKGPRVYFAYKSLAGQAGLFDKIIVYDWMLQRATLLSVAGEYIAGLAKSGLTLENLDAISASIDALAFSLDAVSSAALAQLGFVSSAHLVGFFSGANLEATLQTSEQALGRFRSRIRGMRPVTDAGAAMLSITTRERLQDTAVTGPESAVDGLGNCVQNISTRLMRGRLRIPAGASWSFATGLEPDAVAEGQQ